MVELTLANGTKESMIEWGKAFGLDIKQYQSFQVLLSTFILTYYDDSYVENNAIDLANSSVSVRHKFNQQKRTLKDLGGKEQLLMFMTGPGGSGKSRVIDAVICYGRHFCQELKVTFDEHTIVLTALTGVAATNIAGETLHSAVHLETKTSNIDTNMINAWKNTRLLIIDEISFAKSKILELLDEKLRVLRQKPTKVYGGLNILFAGDFRQLPPVKADPIYYHNHILWGGSLNAFIELDGAHRFSDDPSWGHILKRFRDGCPTMEDFRKINDRVIENSTIAPRNSSFACYGNKDRNAIHYGIFSKHVDATHFQDASIQPPRHTIIIKSDLRWAETQQNISVARSNDIYSFCGDADCQNNSQRCDPMLCLYFGCELMITRNIEVKKNKANGTKCNFKGLKLNIGANPKKERFNGKWVQTIKASDVDTMFCTLNKSKKIIELKPETKQFDIEVPYMQPHTRILQKVLINQFPVIRNTATTGHKLQAQTIPSLIVNDWHYGENWPYVVLSRPTTLSGLFLREELDPSKDYSIDPRLTKHLQDLNSTISIVT